ncbi:hypothetical protein C1S86_20000 [Vibrio parahaemolyticus]|nr:hypothetical protein BSG32_17120 [Vibrio parahaemolyticus]KCV74638.1 hypothetical protein Y011_15035 [Vibrio parahaemolyticus VP49]EGQ8117360.1 hypothetical protein [Vibrio parahaemolyticus]EGQ9759772.1 hypothetical protein [Vibrio parahaemolyticus]EGQ9889080.1 hypothetical protein [Vibrio parahaemolyticus]
MTILCARESQSIQQITVNAKLRVSISKGCEPEEAWYDHGDFTVLCGFSLRVISLVIVLMNS